MTRIDRRILTTSVLLTAVLSLACGGSTTAPTAAAVVTSPTTETFGSLIGIGGGASHAFPAAQSGTISVTLTSVGPPDGVVVGLGIGIPDVNNTACTLTVSTETSAGSTPQLEAAVDSGRYCVRIYDIGNLTDTASFSMTIVRP